MLDACKRCPLRLRFNPRAPLPGRASFCHARQIRGQLVSILAPRCRGAHRRELQQTYTLTMFQSSRPVAGARICRRHHRRRQPQGFNPRAPLPGRASKGFIDQNPVVVVSILAPRCRGAHPATATRPPARLKFQSSRPVAGARIRIRCQQPRPGRRFNPRAPLPGRASRAKRAAGGFYPMFQSSRPVAGARIRRLR